MAEETGYYWANGEPPPTIHIHSLAKHRVLERYLFRYVEILAADPRMPALRIDIVDGFSGGGIYTRADTNELWMGSPLIFLQTLEAVAAKINLTRKNEFHIDARFFFIEEKRENIGFLKKLLHEKGYGSRLGEDIFCIQGNFEDNHEKIINLIKEKSKSGRSIFLLDQYGYKDVPLTVLAKIFSTLKNAEVLLTFAAERLLDFLNPSEAYRSMLDRMGFNQFDPDSIEAIRTQPVWRFFIQAELSRHLHLGSAAKFFTPFFIRSRESNRAYWFVHLSMRARAHDEMVRVHWNFHNHFVHYGGAGFRMLGYDPDKDFEITGRREFAFDETAQAMTISALVEDLGTFIHDHPDGIKFSSIIEENANDAPGSSVEFQEAIMMLKSLKDIEIKTTTGGTRREVTQISGDDIIMPSKQTRLIFD